MTNICKRIVIPNINSEIDIEEIVDVLENNFVLGEVGKLELFKVFDINKNKVYLCNVFFNCFNDDSHIYACDSLEYEFMFRNMYLPNSDYWTMYEDNGIFEVNLVKEIWERDDSEIIL